MNSRTMPPYGVGVALVVCKMLERPNGSYGGS